MFFKHPVQGRIYPTAFGKQYYSACIPVKAVHDSGVGQIFCVGMLSFLFFKKVADYCGVKVIPIRLHRSFGGKVGGLVYNDDGFVLK